MMSDTEGNLPFIAVAVIVGAVIGGVVAAKTGKSVWAGIAIGATAGGLVGLGLGAVSGMALAGSATASTSAVASGAGGLVSAVSSGGLGAGASYVANNFSQATNNAAPAVNMASRKMQEVAAKGKAGEAAAGIVKNTSHISSLTGKANYRIPDGLDKEMKILSEVKNYSGTLSYTSQLKDFVLWS